jgi:transcriptional regulator with GAF, ATPase, and Fis domain
MTLQRRNTLRRQADEAEGKSLRRALEAEGWYKARAARRLGLSWGGFRRALDRHPELLAEATAKCPGRGRPSV